MTAFFYGEMALQPPEEIAKKNTASQTNLIEGSSTQFVPSINVSNKHNEGIQLAGGGSFLFDLLGKAAKNQGDFLEVFNRLNSGSVTKSLDGAPNVPEKVPFLQTEGLGPEGYSATQTKAILGKKHLSESGYEKFKAQDYKSVDTDAPGLNTDAQQALSDIEAEQLADQEIVKDAKAKLPNPKLGHVSASCWSVEHDNPFSLAIIKDGKNMIGQKLFAMSPLKNKIIPVEIVSSHYVDPKGERVRS